MTSNEITDQKMVMAHVYGHCDFFKNNLWFAHTNRKMMDQTANLGNRIRQYMDRYGVDTVENFIDACLSVEDLIDIYAPHIRRTDDRPSVARPQLDGPEEEDENQPIPGRLKSKDYMDAYVNPRHVLAAAAEAHAAKNAQTERRFPAEPMRDVMLFILQHAPLRSWQADVLSIIRDEAYYFAPQAQSKIMNEGWAAYQNDSNPDTKQLAFNRIVNYYAYTNEDESLDSTIYLDSGNVAVKRLIVANYIGKRNGTVAQALLNTMSASNNEDAKFASYYNILINLINNNKRWDQVTTWQRNTITTIANSGTKIAPVALAYLEFLNKSFSFRTNAVEGFAKQTILQNIDYVNATMIAAPNPFSGVTVIKVSIPPSQLWTMKVMDITGRIMVKTQLVAGKYELPISANELNGNGLYFCQLLCDDKPIETIKIICLK